MNEHQLTRRAEKKNPTVWAHLVRTRGIQLFNHIWSKTRGIRLFDEALQWPHSSLRVSVWMTLDISPKNVYSFIMWNGIRNLNSGNQRVSGLSLCESGRLIQSVAVLVEAVSRRGCRTFCAPACICLSACVDLSFILQVTCTDDPHRLPSSLKSFHCPSHCPSIQSHRGTMSTYQCLRNLERIVIGSHRKKKCAWWRSCDSMATNMAHTAERAVHGTPARRRVSTCGECSSGN